MPHLDLAVEQCLGEVGELLGPGAGEAAAARHVRLIAAADINKLEGDRGKCSLECITQDNCAHRVVSCELKDKT